jgi:hypothetical protein
VIDEYGNFNERLVMKITAGAELLVTTPINIERGDD